MRLLIHLTSFFSGIATSLDNDLPPGDDLPPQITPIPHSMFLFPVSPNECVDLISTLKNSRSDVNHITTSLFKDMRHVLADPIAQLINISYQTGIFPSSLKIACITPIFKQGEKTILNNYRPISVLPVLSKIFERSLSNRLICWMSRHAILSSHQFGFRKGKSTVDALISLTEYIHNGLNAKSHTVSVFIDLRKAFDTVQHNILLSKLNLLGVRGLPLKLFESYLIEGQAAVRQDWRE